MKDLLISLFLHAMLGQMCVLIYVRTRVGKHSLGHNISQLGGILAY